MRCAFVVPFSEDLRCFDVGINIRNRCQFSRFDKTCKQQAGLQSPKEGVQIETETLSSGSKPKHLRKHVAGCRQRSSMGFGPRNIEPCRNRIDRTETYPAMHSQGVYGWSFNSTDVCLRGYRCVFARLGGISNTAGRGLENPVHFWRILRRQATDNNKSQRTMRQKSQP